RPQFLCPRDAVATLRRGDGARPLSRPGGTTRTAAAGPAPSVGSCRKHGPRPRRDHGRALGLPTERRRSPAARRRCGTALARGRARGAVLLAAPPPRAPPGGPRALVGARGPK